MSENDLLKTKIRKISGSEKTGKCVLYVMSRDQRVKDNQALLCAQKHAIAKNLPLAVVFCLQESSGVRSREHYEFMLEGLKQVEKDLKKLSIPFIMLIGSPKERLEATFQHLRPDSVYFDFNPLRGPRKLQDYFSKGDFSAYVVDTHNVVPIWVTSEKREVGAYTIRPKIHKKLGEYLLEPEQVIKHPANWPGDVRIIKELSGIIQSVLDKIEPSGIAVEFKTGEFAARDSLETFMNTKLATYAVDRNDPSKGSQSDLSPYLHFGQISALRVALLLQEEAHKNNSELHFLSSPKMPKPEDAENTLQHGIDSLIEEMIVRKELADNFCYYDENYDNLGSAPGWAKAGLDKHRSDPREFAYTLKQLEAAQTHDPAWNAAQRQLTITGKMHGYMRMYWAKKVLEWTESPERAIEFLIFLNDHYSIDGGDPNGYAGIMWSVAGVHDRPWMEREIFGVVRYMNYGGLKRKFNIEAYENQYLNKK
jgi:deoxyribodipyrimidine photo-lyase